MSVPGDIVPEITALAPNHSRITTAPAATPMMSAVSTARAKVRRAAAPKAEAVASWVDALRRDGQASCVRQVGDTLRGLDARYEAFQIAAGVALVDGDLSAGAVDKVITAWEATRGNVSGQRK